MQELSLEVITPEKSVRFDAVSIIVLPTAMGEASIYPNHIASIMLLDAGKVRYTRSDTTSAFNIATGVVEIRDNRVCILTESLDITTENA